MSTLRPVNTHYEQMPLFGGILAEPAPEVNPLAISPQHIAKGLIGLEAARNSLENPHVPTYTQEILPILVPVQTESPVVSKQVVARALADARKALEQSSRTAAVATIESADNDLVAAARHRAKAEVITPFEQPQEKAPTRGVTDPNELADDIQLLAVFLTSKKFEEDRGVLRELAHRD